MLFNDEHSEKASFPIFVTPLGISIISIDLHFLNVQSPISVTLSGIFMISTHSHPENAKSPISVTLSGISMLFNDEHSLNAAKPISVTLSGISMLFKCQHLALIVCILIAFHRSVRQKIGFYIVLKVLFFCFHSLLFSPTLHSKSYLPNQHKVDIFLLCFPF